MDITPLNKDTVVNIDEFNFTIPEGYGESEDDRYNNTNDYVITTIQYNYPHSNSKIILAS